MMVKAGRRRIMVGVSVTSINPDADRRSRVSADVTYQYLRGILVRSNLDAHDTMSFGSSSRTYKEASKKISSSFTAPPINETSLGFWKMTFY
jgi:hypothetical protein